MEEKVRFVIDYERDEESMAELCAWSKMSDLHPAVQNKGAGAQAPARVMQSGSVHGEILRQASVIICKTQFKDQNSAFPASFMIPSTPLWPKLRHRRRQSMTSRAITVPRRQHFWIL